MFRLFHRHKITIMALSDSTNQLVFAESRLIQTLTQAHRKKELRTSISPRWPDVRWL